MFFCVLRQARRQAFGDLARRGRLRKFCNLFPEFFRLFLGVGGVGAQPGFPLVEQRRLRLAKAGPVSSQQRFGCRPIADLQLGGKPDAGREPDQIERIGHHRGLVEIVDAPDQAAVGVAPGAEIFQMQVADRKHLRGIHQIRTQFSDLFGPAEIGRAQEDEGALFHPDMLVLDVFLDDFALSRQPGFVVAIVLAKRHKVPLRFDRSQFC